MAIQGRPWSLLVVPIRACWWWEREIGGDCLARLWREKLRERKSVRGRERERERYWVKRERENAKFYRNFKFKKFCTNLPILIWLIENIYFWLDILLQNKHCKIWKYFSKNILHWNKQSVRIPITIELVCSTEKKKTYETTSFFWWVHQPWS